MTASRAVRQFHRWIAIVFTLGVATYMAAMSQGTPPSWLGLFALAPLILLLVTGLYLFALPYLRRGRTGADGAQGS